MKSNAARNRIIELCKKNEITVNALAVKSNAPPSTLKNIVYGNVESTGIDAISKICEELNISLPEFFTSDYFEEEDKVNGNKN